MISNSKTKKTLLDSYPYRIIFTRWFFAAAEMGLASYFVFSFHFQLGFLFLIYGLVCVFVLLPLIRCVRCGYYGKRCNFGWGVMISRLFPKAEGESFFSAYGYTVLIWPLRIIPLGVGFLRIIDGFMGGFHFVPQGLLGIYLLVMIIHRRFYRARACTRCRQKDVCPVYDVSCMRGRYGGDEAAAEK
jgi:hypothetical protein